VLGSGLLAEDRDVERHPDAVHSGDVVIVRPESELFYVNADNVHAAIRSHIIGRTRAVVLDLESVPAIDFTATEMLRTLDDELTSSGVRLAIASEAGQVGDLLRQAGAGHLVDKVHPSVDSAVRALAAGLDRRGRTERGRGARGGAARRPARRQLGTRARHRAPLGSPAAGRGP
jgi:sulfate permease, SulP family